jgi:hypothetical protein
MAIFHLLTAFDYGLMATLFGVFVLAAIDGNSHR